MPRRHNRDEQIPPLTITPADIPKPRRPKTFDEIKAQRERNSERYWEQRRAAEKQRLVEAIDWSRCLVPTCDGKVMSFAGTIKDPDRLLPLCTWHEVGIWQNVQRRSREPEIITAAQNRAVLLDAEDARAEEDDQRRFLARQDGHIYFVRLNGLIKVGWSRILQDRLKAYGPDVEVLCHYRGTRQDETNLHRNLTPYRAKGREWYQDCKLIADMVEQAVKQHGPPHIEAEWTIPTEKPIRARKGSRSKPTGLSI